MSLRFSEFNGSDAIAEERQRGFRAFTESGPKVWIVSTIVFCLIKAYYTAG